MSSGALSDLVLDSENVNALIGTSVVIAGLQSRPELNGAAATLLAFDTPSGRFGVTVTMLAGGGIPSESTSIRVKPQNLLQTKRVDENAPEKGCDDSEPWRSDMGSDIWVATCDLEESHGAEKSRRARELLNAGMPVDHRCHGKTLLHYCACHGVAGFAKELLQRGADMNATYDVYAAGAECSAFLSKQNAMWHGATPLLFAASRGYTSMVALLLDHGAKADVRLPDEQEFPFRIGANALQMAKGNGYAEIARLIEDYQSGKRSTQLPHKAKTPTTTQTRAQRTTEDQSAFDAIVADALKRELLTEADHSALTDRLAAGRATRGKLVEELLARGTGVVLTGLVKAPELNGKRGVVIGRRVAGSGRFPVRLSDREGLRVKATSLRLLNQVDKRAALREASLAKLHDDALTDTLAAVVHAGVRALNLVAHTSPAVATCRLFNSVLRERVLRAVALMRASLLRMRAKRELMFLQEGVILQEYKMCRPGWRMFDADHPVWELEPAMTHSTWSALQGIRLSVGTMVDKFRQAESDEDYSPRIRGGQLLLVPDTFEETEQEWAGGYATAKFRETNPLLRSYRIARSYSMESLEIFGL